MNSPDASFQLLACRYLRKQTKALLAHVESIDTGDDAEYICRARVASRRIRAALGVFEGGLPTKKVRRWSKHIRRLTKGLGAARDRDVQIAFVAGLAADRAREKRTDAPGLERLLLRPRQEREAIQPSLAKALERLDAAGMLGEMLAKTKKCMSRLRRADTGPKSALVLKRGARDIRKVRDRLLELQSCLEDAGAIPQHHQMRIVAKKLRYTMEIYKKAFDRRLNETIKTVRRVQTLVGDIHDCDVWDEVIQRFMEEERERTVEYFGQARSFRRLRPGLEYFRNERITHRRETFDELVALWQDLQDRGFWEELDAGLEASHTKSRSQAPRTAEPASETELSETPDERQPRLRPRYGHRPNLVVHVHFAGVGNRRRERSKLPRSQA